jgi:hypothetical protein
MKKLGLVLLIVILLITGSLVRADTGWIYQGECTTNGQKTSDCYYRTPVIQLPDGYLVIVVEWIWTNYGKQAYNIPSNVKYSWEEYLYSPSGQGKVIIKVYYGYNNEVVQEFEFPGGGDWVTPQSGTMWEILLNLARTAPKN